MGQESRPCDLKRVIVTPAGHNAAAIIIIQCIVNKKQREDNNVINYTNYTAFITSDHHINFGMINEKCTALNSSCRLHDVETYQEPETYDFKIIYL